MLLRNGYVVTETGVGRRDLRIEGEQIAELGERLVPRTGEETIELTGKIVLPGGVDTHTYLAYSRDGVRSADDFHTGTVAAAFGGTTTIVNQMSFAPETGPVSSRLQFSLELARGQAVIDFGLHGNITAYEGEESCNQMEELAKLGVTSCRFFLTGPGRMRDGEILPLMERAARLGVLLCVRPENEGAVRYLEKKCRAEGRTGPLFFARCRPPASEAMAVNRMLLLAMTAGNPPLYYSPLSCGLGLEFLRTARWRGQPNLYAETCPQYLYLDNSRYLEPDGLKYIVNPPLRSRRDTNLLWEAVCGGEIDVIASAHRSYSFSRDKIRGRGDFSLAPAGLPGIETRMPLLFAEVSRGRLGIERMVGLCCTNPARLFGLYPRKGVIAVGSDADLAVYGQGRPLSVARELLHENTDYTPFERLPFDGLPEMTVSRGEIIVQNGRFIGKKGRGRYLRRGPPNLGT